MIGSQSSQRLLEQLVAEITDADVDNSGDSSEGDNLHNKNKSLFNFSSSFTENDLIVMVSLLSGFSKNDFYCKLYSLFGRETILFLSMFNGCSMKVPDIRYLLKLKKFSKIYLYIKENEFTDEAYEAASKKYKKSVEKLRIITDKVRTCMNQFKELFTCGDSIGPTESVLPTELLQ